MNEASKSTLGNDIEKVDYTLEYADLPKERLDQLIQKVDLLIHLSRQPNLELFQLSQEEIYQWFLNKLSIQPEMAEQFPELKKVLTACQRMAEKLQIIKKYKVEAEKDPKKFLEKATGKSLKNAVTVTLKSTGFIFEVDNEDMGILNKSSSRGATIGVRDIPELEKLIYIINHDKGESETIRHEQIHGFHHIFHQKRTFKYHEEPEVIEGENYIETLFESDIEREQDRAFYKVQSEFAAYATASPPRIFGSLEVFGIYEFKDSLKNMESVNELKISYGRKQSFSKKMKEVLENFRKAFEQYQLTVHHLFRYSNLTQDQIVSLILATPFKQLKSVSAYYIDFNLPEQQIYIDAKRRFSEEGRKWNADHPNDPLIIATLEELFEGQQEEWEEMQQEVGKFTFLDHIGSLARRVRRRMANVLKW